jgi:hypothetical protein
MKLSFEDALAMGELAVVWAADRLIADRWAVIRLDELPAQDGHGPRLFGDTEPALPDLQVTKYAKTCAVEVKAKTGPVLRRVTGQWEHGIDRAAFDQYWQYERQMATFLLIVEVGEDRSRRLPWIARVKDLRPHYANDNYGNPMAYWPRDEQMQSDWLTRLNRWAAPRKGRP